MIGVLLQSETDQTRVFALVERMDLPPSGWIIVARAMKHQAISMRYSGSETVPGAVIFFSDVIELDPFLKDGELCTWVRR